VLAFGAAMALALSLAACGRRGPLDLPPSDTPTPNANGANLTTPAIGPSASSSLTTSQVPASAPMSGPQGMFGSSASSSGPPPNAVDANGHPIYQPPPSRKSFILDPILQ
jgi:predicted small lipoprotein YifL